MATIRAHQRAAQQGNIDSLLAIGDAHYYGRGVARDWPQAFQVYSAAARFRNAQASHSPNPGPTQTNMVLDAPRIDGARHRCRLLCDTLERGSAC